MNNLELGFKAHQAGQLQSAQQYYLQHLLEVKDDPTALQLLGLINSGDTMDSSSPYSNYTFPACVFVGYALF